MRETEALLRQIPNVDRMLANPALADGGVYRHEIADAVREVLSGLRVRIIASETDFVPQDDELAQCALKLARDQAQQGLRSVINGTGVMLHSNLGRACISKAASQAAKYAAAGYSTLEYDHKNGTRGLRAGYIEKQLCDITGCEAALIVNNNAAAVLLILSAIASGGNVIVSRGELVEIGGGFRVPDIMAHCGCELREVGTTNKTRLSDYYEAIDNNTRALLKVHSSNFKIVGFTQSVSIKELTELGAERNIPVIDDIGSGALVDMRKYGIYDEPFAPDSLKYGAEVVSQSGDKLLGGPQCGIVLGQKRYIDAMKKHPMYRATRADKMKIAAMEATLRVYSDPLTAERNIPVLSMLAMPLDELRLRAEKLCGEINKRGGDAQVISTKSATGGGTVPGLEFESFAVMPTERLSAEETERTLRAQHIPIIGRIEKDRLLLDVRTLFQEDFDYIADTIAGLFQS